jgi:serine/threonine protein phosphatase 1
MTYVFTDIHGCLRAFDALLDELQPSDGDTVIALGDYIDRGADSKGVIDRLIGIRDELTLVALRGNHEIMMQEALLGPPASGFWMMNGGLETLDSYNVRSLKGLPEEHWEFLYNLRDIHVAEPFLFTHATPPPELSVAEFDEESLFWSRFTNLRERKDGRFLICGHTPQTDRRPSLRAGHLCLDTGCCHGGYLTALTLETGAYLQTSEEGQFRDGWLDLPTFAG